jgi:tetratricopeptide (TPR) repeat protein
VEEQQRTIKVDEAGPSGPAKGHKAIWVFTPSRTHPEDLEFIFVQRRKLLQEAVERVRKNALAPNKHQLLYVGPRGCGKTHLVTLLVSRLAADEKPEGTLRIAWLNEDETSTSLLEFLVKICTALVKRYPQEFSTDAFAGVYEREPEAALETVSRHLVSSLGARALLIVAENLDALFEGLGQEEQAKLRSFLQAHPQFSLVATAQQLVEDLADRDNPFFGFFQIEHLKPLKVEEATELLQNIARLHGEHALVEFLGTGRGRARVRALHHLSGGNHRIYIVLSQFITRDSIDSLLRPFMKMVDELTPYYQERIRWLPPLQRRIVEFLCSCPGTVPVKDIAKRLFASSQTISGQLQNLREKGYVEANQRGRESLYEISEPLMRICVEVKENQSHQPFRLLVDFLRVWYDDQELKRRHSLVEAASDACAYLESAIERNRKEGNLRKNILLRDVELSLPEQMEMSAKAGVLRELSGKPEAVVLASKSLHEGNLVEAERCLDEAIAAETEPAEKKELLFCRAAVHEKANEPDKAIGDYTAVIELPAAPVEWIAEALTNRGIVRRQSGDLSLAIEDYAAVLELPGAPLQQVVRSHVSRGIAYGVQGRWQEAIEDFTAVFGIDGAPVDEVSWALVGRGIAYDKQGKMQLAVRDFTRVIETVDAPTEQIAQALVLRGFLFFQQNRQVELRSDMEALVSLPAAPIHMVVGAHFELAKLHFEEGRWDDGFAALDAALGHGPETEPPYRTKLASLTGAVFSAALNPATRRGKVGSYLRLCETYQVLPALGEAVVEHIGTVFRAGEPFPAPDNLEGWAAAWEEAAANVPDFALAIRLLRVGVNFVKAGGQDRGVLLDLTAGERAILEQAFGLADQN